LENQKNKSKQTRDYRNFRIKTLNLWNFIFHGPVLVFFQADQIGSLWLFWIPLDAVDILLTRPSMVASKRSISWRAAAVGWEVFSTVFGFADVGTSVWRL
jgi:hypothetical protein